MSRFCHFLLTRFSISLPEEILLPDNSWLEHRVQLFERLCLPSVITQSCQNFKWLVFFNSASRETLLARIRTYGGYGNFVPVWLDGPWDSDILRWAVAEYARGHEYMITSRLDNDDAIATRYIETIQDQFESQNFEFVNFTNGYILDRQAVYACQQWSNPFISLIERGQDFRTALGCGNHLESSEMGPVRQVGSFPGWLQVVHSRNISNRIWGNRVAAEELAPHFSIYPACLEGPEL